jgi:hypothetical protein
LNLKTLRTDILTMATPDKRPRPDDEIEDEYSPNPSDKQKSKTTDGVETMDLEESRVVQTLNKPTADCFCCPCDFLEITYFPSKRALAPS